MDWCISATSMSTSTFLRGCLVVIHQAFLDVFRILQVVSGQAKRRKRVMVFCNTLDSCRATEHFLSEAGLSTLSYHGQSPLLQLWIGMSYEIGGQTLQKCLQTVQKCLETDMNLLLCR